MQVGLVSECTIKQVQLLKKVKGSPPGFTPADPETRKRIMVPFTATTIWKSVYGKPWDTHRDLGDQKKGQGILLWAGDGENIHMKMYSGNCRAPSSHQVSMLNIAAYTHI